MSFLDTIFGGSHSSSTNQAYPWAQSTFGPTSGQAFNSGTQGLEGLLGMSGGDPNALNKFWGGTGGQFLLNKGVNDINSNFYARGLGQSGAAMKGLENYRSGLASTKLNDLMQNYMGLSKLGLGGGALVTDAGKVASGSESSGGLGSTIGSVLSSLAMKGAFMSDRRLKTNITKLGEAKDGLGIYEWNWKADPKGPAVRGVIADEVERLRPWAFVPNFRGEYAGVNYGTLGSLA